MSHARSSLSHSGQSSFAAIQTRRLSGEAIVGLAIIDLLVSMGPTLPQPTDDAFGEGRSSQFGDVAGQRLHQVGVRRRKAAVGALGEERFLDAEADNDAEREPKFLGDLIVLGGASELFRGPLEDGGEVPVVADDLLGDLPGEFAKFGERVVVGRRIAAGMRKFYITAAH